MRTATLIALASLGLGLVAGTARAIPNPYRCDFSGNQAWLYTHPCIPCPSSYYAQACTQGNAERLAKNYAARRFPNSEYYVNDHCDPVPLSLAKLPDAKPRVWACVWGSTKTGALTVTFDATHNGWQFRITNAHLT